jgi:uncharacterized membrane protein
VVAIILAKSENKKTSEKTISFSWPYIVLPVAIFLISVILAIYFYRLLPPEVAYHFQDGSPDRWMNRSAIIAWLVIPQFLLVFIGLAISGGTTILSRRSWQTENAQLRKVLLITGNMVALPQIILAFAMLDIFLYNAYQIHLIPVWVFALIIIVLGSIVLGIFFIQALRHSRKLPGRSLQE